MAYNPGKTDFMEIWPGPYKKCMKYEIGGLPYWYSVVLMYVINWN
jgi:hypothetical protein